MYILVVIPVQIDCVACIYSKAYTVRGCTQDINLEKGYI